MENNKIIAVDFDGTLSFGTWPDVGEPNVPLIEQLKDLKSRGNKLILWTCRAGEALDLWNILTYKRKKAAILPKMVY
ncbi:MAG: hypothetical protein K6B28_04605 [Lachnospiraceae bacterium]|nr:hypothetical protein [Lachnospiraceae bacterium]